MVRVGHRKDPVEAVGEIGGQFAFEMYPVQGPGILLVDPVGVGLPGGDDERLSGPQDVGASLVLHPALAVRAIKQDPGVAALRPLPPVVPRVGEVPDVGQVEPGGERVATQGLRDGRREYDHPAACKSIFESKHRCKGH